MRYSVLARAMLVSTSLLAASAAQAQQDAASDSTSPNASDDTEIVVTATRRAESLQDVPVAVDVVGGEAIEKYNLNDFKDIQALTPGLQLTNDSGRNNVATLRGITFDPDSGSSPAVDTFFNEIPVDPQTSFTSIYDIGQIEVLRGPQGLFRGRTSPAGSITLTTRKPNLSRPEGYVQLSGTNLDGVNFQGAASLPLATDVLAMRAAMVIDSNRANHIENVSGERSHNSTMSGRLSIAYAPSASFHADLMYQYLYADVRPFIAVFGAGNQPSLLDPSRSGPAISIDDRLSMSEAAPRFQNRTHLVTLQTEYDFGGASLVYNGGYQDTQLTQYRDQDPANAVPNYALPQTVRTGYRVWSNELRLQSNGDGRLTWFIAGNYNWQKNPVTFDQRNDQFVGLAFTPLPPSLGAIPVIVNGVIDIKTNNYSLAGSVGYELIDGLTLTAGVRHTWYDVDRTQVTSVAAAGGPASVSTNSSTIRDRYFTGGASLSWEATPDLTAYLSYGRSARPGVFAVGVSVPLDPQYLQTPMEKSDGFEAGVKANLFDRHASLNLAAFYQKFDNYIAYAPALTTNSSRVPGLVDPVTAPLPTYGNAIAKGVEVQFSAHPSRNFDFSVNASYADSHYDNAAIYCNDYNGDGMPDSTGTPRVPGTAQVARCTTSERLAQVPKFNLSSTAELRVPLGSWEGFGRTLVSYRPGRFSTLDNYDYRAFTNVNLYLGVRGPDASWEIAVFARNLLDQTRASSVSPGFGQFGTTDYSVYPPVSGAPFNSGYRTAVINSPREFGASINFKW